MGARNWDILLPYKIDRRANIEIHPFRWATTDMDQMLSEAGVDGEAVDDRTVLFHAAYRMPPPLVAPTNIRRLRSCEHEFS